MRRLLSGSVVAVAVAALGVGLAPPSSTSPPTAAPRAPQADQPLDAYTARGVSAEQLRTLARQGYDLHEAHPTGDTTRVDLVLTRANYTQH